MAALGPQPLIRHGPEGQLELRPEGLELLRRIGAPVHVAFAIGGSRCGKSTAGNALIFGAEAGADAGFETGSSFDPVTTGVDVAARLLPGGGALIVSDCEGAFHICGSSRSARGFGALGLVAYHLSSALLHVSMGSIDERDVEVLGHLATSASTAGAVGSGHREARLDLLAGTAGTRVPTLVLLVNGARFDMGDAVARRLLRPPDSGDPDAARRSSRSAIARGFRGQPALEALPACEHAAYWPKVDALRRRLLETAPMVLSSGLQATGADVAERLAEVVSALGGIEAPGNATTSLAREPESATEALYRTEHLDPLVEEIARRFAAAGAGAASSEAIATAKPLSPSKRAVEDALTEFDRRTAWLLNGTSVGSGAPPVREGLVKDVRMRLAARLAGINEALARGRQQGAVQRPRGLILSGATPPSTPPATDDTAPSTPSKRTLGGLEVAITEAERHLERSRALVAEEISKLQATFSAAQQQVAQMAENAVDAERQTSAAAAALEERWSERLREAAQERMRSVGAQASKSTATIAEMQAALRETEGLLPDVGICSSQLNDLRAGLEEERLRRCAAADSAAREVEDRLHKLREALEEEGGNLLSLRESVGRHLTESAEAFRGQLQEEKRQREDRYFAMAEVVDRLRVSLEASAEAAEVGEPPPLQSRGGRRRAPAQPVPPPAPPPPATPAAGRWGRGSPADSSGHAPVAEDAGSARRPRHAGLGHARPPAGEAVQAEAASECRPQRGGIGGALAVAALAGEAFQEAGESPGPPPREYMV